MINREIIYDSTEEKFFDDVRLNKFADIMKENFEKNSGYKTNPSEYSSWVVTGEKVKNLVEISNLKNIYLSFEYQVPYSQNRIDCMLFGKNKNKKGTIIHIEIKQWSSVKPLDVEGNFVETYVGGKIREKAHPSQQVEGYNDYLIGFVEIFEENQIDLFGCAYCPNYKKSEGDGLFSNKYSKILEKFPIYAHDDVKELALKIKELLQNGDGFEIFNKFMQSPVEPSKKLLENTSKVISNTKVFSLINDQIIAKNIILDKIKKAEKTNEKNVVIINGGPGTGKTVIALNILAEMAAKRKKIFFSSKSKPLIEAIKNNLSEKNSKLLFTSLNAFIPSKVNENELDILIVDEAHRIGKISNNQFTKSIDRTDMPQIDQLIRCSKTSIFFIDNNQIIRSVEVGNTSLIKQAAIKYNCRINECELVSQFRCMGSDNYVDYLESIFGYSSERKYFNLKSEKFEFKIFGDPKKLYDAIFKKNSGKITSRLVAGFCWKWSKKLDSNGNLVKDIKIGDFEMPWETHGEIKTPEGYVKWYEWAYKPNGIKQVGCIYTAQGFEFDYIGVIVGPDLKYDKVNDCLIGDITKTQDPMLRKDKGNFDKYVKNIYRVLLTRGLKGCYIYFVDKDVEKYFKKYLLY